MIDPADLFEDIAFRKPDCIHRFEGYRYEGDDRREITIGHLRKPKEDSIYNLLAVKTIGDRLAHALVAKEIGTVVFQIG